ncbi:MAG: hypothetical protein ACT4PO_16085 [Actinomycetota bacterium]
MTCCRFSALKTFDIPATSPRPAALVNVSTPGAALAGFQVSINGRFWVSTEGTRASSPAAAGPAARVRPLRVGSKRRGTTASNNYWSAAEVLQSEKVYALPR